jgi:cytochrome c biogenesis protein CcmG, thiol:disulfide interchange protein DsbE
MKSTVLKENSSTHLKKHGLLYLLLVVVLAVVAYRIQFSPIQKTALNQERPEVGHPAPGFTLRNLQGNLEGLVDYKDQVIVLNFWATWCAPCLEEMPAFEKLYRRYRSQGLTVLAVSLDKGDISTVKGFVDANNLTFSVLIDSDGVAEKLYPSFTIPFTYVIDKDGRIAARVDGAKNWASSETFAALDILIKG